MLIEKAGNTIKHLDPNIAPVSNVKSILMDKHKLVKQTCTSHNLDLDKHVGNKANVGNDNDKLSISDMELCHTIIKENSSTETNELQNNYVIISEVRYPCQSSLMFSRFYCSDNHN